MSQAYLEFVDLEKQIKYHDYLYSVADKPIISDSEYDILVQRYHTLLSEHPEYKPSHTPGFVDVPEGFKVVKLVEPMISILKKKSVDDFQQWIKKNTEGGEVYEEKLDGLGLRLIYKFGGLTIAHLRGSQTQEGLDVTHRVKLVSNIPKQIDEFKHLEYSHVDGEVFCMFKDLERYCEQWDKDYAETEPRSTVSGMMKRLKDNERDTLTMYFRAYGASTSVRALCNDYEHLRTKLEDWGFDTPQRLDGSLLQSLYKLKERPDFGYPIDGIVVKVNDLSKWNDTHMVGYYTYTACYKFPTRCLETKLKDVIWGLSTQGELVGVVTYDPVEYDGTILQRAKFDYANEYIKAGIRIGSIIQVTKANEIIPNIVGVKEIGNGKKIEFPTKCPCCDSLLVIETPAVRRCVNDSCSGKFLKQMNRLVGPRGLDIKGLGKKGLEALVDAGYLSSPQDLFKLTRDDYLNLDVFDQNQVDSILEQISETPKLPLNNWLFASCIPNMGVVAALELAQEQGKLFSELSTLMDVLKNSDILVSLFGVDGLVMSKYVKDNEAVLMHFFIHYNFSNPIQTVPDAIPVAISGGWLIPREELRKRLAEDGYELVDSVTKSVTRLLLGKDPSPGKIAKAEKYGIRTLVLNNNVSYDNLLTMLAS
ncbi:putative DNA ligase [Aeromonas phage CF8]|nr:putative DNA ligase [Aeromonas phage CF8]